MLANFLTFKNLFFLKVLALKNCSLLKEYYLKFVLCIYKDLCKKNHFYNGFKKM